MGREPRAEVCVKVGRALSYNTACTMLPLSGSLHIQILNVKGYHDGLKRRQLESVVIPLDVEYLNV